MLVEAAKSQLARELVNYFVMTVKGTIAPTKPSLGAVPIAAVEVVPRRQQLRDALEDRFP